MKADNLWTVLTRERRAPGIWAAVLFMLVAVSLPAIMAGYVLGGEPAPGFTGFKISALPFDRPTGCPALPYADGDKIPRACAVEANLLKEPQIVGLPGNNGGRGKRWYRVGNDALMLSCGLWSDMCRVYSKAPNKYVVGHER